MSSNNNQKNDIVLTIGMIIKNEEAVLERCLKSLKPLMEAVPCELIIADTGSKDASVSIAEKYADNVIHFKWVNDFAAARNASLDIASGKWYFFLDADEYLDSDISEIADFFSSPEKYNSFNTLYIHLRNYKNREKTKYSDTYLARFFRLHSKEIRFSGAIHETITVNFPVKNFETILHHTGYCYESEQQMARKMERNLALMREEYKKERSLRMVTLLLNAGADYPEECEEYINFAIDYAEKNLNDPYGPATVMNCIKYLMSSKPEKALKICNKYFDFFKDCSKMPETISVEKFRTDILYSLFQYEKSYEAFKSYQKLYYDCKNGLIPPMSLTGSGIKGITEDEYHTTLCKSVRSLINLRKFDTAEKLLTHEALIRFNNDEFKLSADVLFELSSIQSDYASMAVYYETVYKTDDKNKINYVLEKIQEIYSNLATEKRRVEFAEKFSSECSIGKYAELIKLTVNPDTESINKFITTLTEWNNNYAETVYLAFRHNCDITPLVKLIDFPAYEPVFKYAAENHDDFAEYVLRYSIPDDFLMDINRLGWITYVYKYASDRAFDLNEENIYALYSRFVSLLGDYVMNLYNPDFLNDEAVGVLSELHRFGYYMYQADSALMAGDKTGYVRCIKKALINCESMKEIIEFLFEWFKRSL